MGGGRVILSSLLSTSARYDRGRVGANPPASTVFRVTFAEVCIVCGGPVAVWGPQDAKCVGWCGSKQHPIEDISPEQWARMVRVLQRAVDPVRPTERQMSILWLMTEGCTRDVMARRLGIGESTVRIHMSDLYDRIGAKNKAHAVAIGFRKGWLE